MRSSTREFTDEHGSHFRVTRISFGRFDVHADSKIAAARSCARKLGMGELAEATSDHGRIWNAIWKYGEDVSRPEGPAEISPGQGLGR